MNITTVILTRNEEERIGKCIDCLGWCNEIIIIDDCSEDNTVKIAKDRGVVVYKRKLNNDFGSQRNFGLSKAKNDWVLFIDADEITSSTLIEDIVRRVKEERFSAFCISRKEVFLNKPLCCSDKPIWDWSFGPIKLIRLVKKGTGKWQGKVHEEWKTKEKVGNLKGFLHHHSFKNLTNALEKINFYTSIQAKELAKKGEKVKISKIVVYPIGKFLKNFIWHQGFRDKTPGIIFSLLMSFHSFLVRGKLWQLTREDK